MESYRCVCPLCQTVLESALPHGRFETFGSAAAVMKAHLLHRCEKTLPPVDMMDFVVNAGVEVMEAA